MMQSSFFLINGQQFDTKAKNLQKVVFLHKNM